MFPPFSRRWAGWTLLTTLFSGTGVTGLGIHRTHSTLQTSYDYIIAGGGLTGLVVTNRLSENSNGLPPPLLSTQVQVGFD